MKTVVSGIVVPKSGVNRGCASAVSHVKVKNSADASKVMNVVETCLRDRRDLIRDGEMRIKNETQDCEQMQLDEHRLD